MDAVQELFFTGHDTSASSMTNILMFLGRHPEVLQRVREELDSEGLLDCPDEELDMSLNKICKLKYVYSVVREVLRVTSPVGAGYRKALRTFEVGVSKISLFLPHFFYIIREYDLLLRAINYISIYKVIHHAN